MLRDSSLQLSFEKASSCDGGERAEDGLFRNCCWPGKGEMMVPGYWSGKGCWIC
jgi:hypothetical protein